MRDVIKELGVEGLTQEEKDDVLIQITDSLLKRLVLRVYDKLNDADQAEFDRLTEAGDMEKINGFLQAKVPDLDEIRDAELDELVGDTKEFLVAAKQ